MTINNTTNAPNAEIDFSEAQTQTLGDIYGPDLEATLESTFGDGAPPGKTLVVNGGFGLIKARFANWQDWLK